MLFIYTKMKKKKKETSTTKHTGRKPDLQHTKAKRKINRNIHKVIYVSIHKGTNSTDL